ncbi:O-antigen polymerase [Anabaena sp. UHCC 0399]|uniref:O-antigen polymerase n=1 Tax=Anabaena sp. UHCC 0399 TaxID=3110238 RepID=UPI002B20BBF8|nr:O-antigen polymerase [Anabaena sp. UHCC 0399]MEA5566421.1 O-antigen polymerase [Anabaena sp. UHCC 0399]
MWRTIFTPEILFFFGMIQALSPYILWNLQGLNPSYHYEITYLPIVIWVIGYVSFLIGTKIIKTNRNSKVNLLVKISLNDLNFITKILIFLSIVQILLAIKLYGVIPIYGYVKGTANVLDINSIQREAGFGQLGFLSVTLFFINGILLIWTLKLNEIRGKANIWFLCILMIEIFAGIMAGKRQSLLMTIMFLSCGLSIYYNNFLVYIFNIIYIPRNPVLRLILSIMGLVFIVTLIGILGSLRTGSNSDDSGIDQIITYLQLPLINLEAQCRDIGLIPEKTNLLYPLLSLLPKKIYEGLIFDEIDFPIRPEPTIGAGFYGTIHWGTGIIGIIIYSLIFGLISKYFYKGSFNNLLHLLVYCQISWTLFSAHTYNHFLNLIYLPIPTVVFVIFCYIFNRTNKKILTI